MEYIISFMETYGYTAMFIAMVLENANVPIPSEIVLGFAGYLIAQGIFDMHMVNIYFLMNINLNWQKRCLINMAV